MNDQERAPEPGPGAPEFTYRADEFHAEDVPLARIAEAVGTPFYCYSSAQIEHRYRRFAAAFDDRPAMLCYSVKANSNLAVISTLARLGAGADVVSEGEFRRALAAGIPGERIIFSGIGKTEDEMAFALAHGVHQINVESLPELEALSRVASRLGRTAPIAVRVNPDVDARTHAKIATGKKENKFGIDLAHVADAYRIAARLPGIAPTGIALHIGSQLTELGPFETAFTRVVELLRALRADGIALSRLDFGGGVGIRYRDEQPPAIEQYAVLVKRLTEGLDVTLAFEPGRFIVGNAGVLVARVLYVKEGVTRRFVVQDAAMNDLVRHAMYDAWHEIVPVRRPTADAPHRPADVVGPVCETGDAFAAQRPLPPLAAGDLLAILSAGAYGAVMSSSYNTRLPVPEVLVRGAEFAVVRPRPSYEALLAQERMPPWLAER
jgi:diaminopimelate decarboxylase